jgi:predicted transglutaminase-like cysteine proteinase
MKSGRAVGVPVWLKRAGLSLAGLLLFGSLARAESPGSLSGAANAAPPFVWTKLQSELERERKVISHCRADIDGCTNPAARRFIAIIEEGVRYEGKARIAHINRAANFAVRSTPKPMQNWTTPLAALAAGAGDCKQFTVLKYAALIEAGLGAEDLRILIVKDKARRATHAVVAARAGTQWLVLKNARRRWSSTATSLSSKPCYGHSIARRQLSFCRRSKEVPVRRTDSIPTDCKP